MLVKPIPSLLPAEKQGDEPDSDFIVFPTPASHAGAGCAAGGRRPATSQPRWGAAGAIDTARPGGYPLAPRFEHTMTDRSVAPTIAPQRRRTFSAQVAEFGRRAGFRYLWPQGRGSSSLLLGTNPIHGANCVATRDA